ncbi:MAG: IS110 family transposase [Pseudomonadota bacterium]
MESVAGLDVGVKHSTLCVVRRDAQSMKTVSRHRTVTTPPAIGEWLAAQGVGRVGLEAGAQSAWLARELAHRGLEVTVMETRRQRAFGSYSKIKTDERDARLIGEALATGLYTKVHVRSAWSQEVRALLGARLQLKRQAQQSRQFVRGQLRAIGIELGRASGKKWLAAAEAAVAERGGILGLTLQVVLSTCAALAEQVAVLDKEIRRLVRQDAACRRMMTAPGAGPLSSLALRASLDDAERFQRSAEVGPYLGLTPARWQSGAMDRRGGITKHGDGLVRAYLYEAAVSLLERQKRDCPLRRWGLQNQERLGKRRARVAVARKLAVLMHKLWRSGQVFDWNRGMEVARTH